MSKLITVKEAITRVAERVLDANIRGMSPHSRTIVQRVAETGDRTFLTAQYSRSFGVSCTLSVEIDTLQGDNMTYRDRNTGVTVSYTRHKPIVQVSWAACGSNSVSTAVACIALFREVTELAADLEAMLDGVYVGTVKEGDPTG